jgi:hypothetical protein
MDMIGNHDHTNSNKAVIGNTYEEEQPLQQHQQQHININTEVTAVFDFPSSAPLSSPNANTIELVNGDAAPITIDVPIVDLTIPSPSPISSSSSAVVAPRPISARPSRSSSNNNISNDSKRERSISRVPSMSPDSSSSSSSSRSRPVTSSGIAGAAVSSSRGGSVVNDRSSTEFLRRGDGQRPKVVRSKVLSRNERLALERRYLNVTSVRAQWSCAMNNNDDTSPSIESIRLKWNRVIKCMDGVCILRLPGGRSGTGFMFGDSWIMTNAHFLTSMDEARTCTATFFYDDDTTSGTPVTVALDPSVMWCWSPKVMFTLPDQDHMDYAIVGLALSPLSTSTPMERASMERVRSITPLRTATISSIPPCVGDRVYIIQHPLGKAKQYHEDVLTKSSRYHVRYACDTNLGSSGSPVIDLDGTVVALVCITCYYTDVALI